MDIDIVIRSLGWVGSIEILIAYWLVSNQKLDSKSMNYQLLNLSGSFFLIVLTCYTKTWAAVFLNVVWFIIALIAVIKLVLTNKK